MLASRRTNTPRRFKYLVYAVLFVAGIMILRKTTGNTNTVISPLPEEKKIVRQTAGFFTPQAKDPDRLKKAIKAKVGTTWSNYSVYVVDYTSPFRMGINESIIYTAASINKVPILAAIYDSARSGTIDFDRVITVQKEDIQDYGTGSIRYDPPGTTYSVKTLIGLMTQKSDNTAAYILANYVVGFEKIQNYINGLGLTQTDLLNNKTSNKDMAILFEKIYQKKITTPALADEMLGFLSDSDFEDRLPALLPSGTKVYHKIGTAEGAVHDAGIVTHGETAYYIGVFTSDVPDEEQAAVLVSEISKIVYDFMTSAK